ncbi:tetratricopeptide repeat protein 6 isoform X1 [Monodelphis domestica]|uniref:tetratricopeptide repeat protein 6 isoform X1 n=1 Tax=Monodelphis domestica TaxID=13616 RepID=UPI0024E250AA|nr:tetratricopeptide repeat protein 6 isoform X1 [Monodelphis domestica]
MSRVPKHFGLNYNEELNMLKELEKVRKNTRKEFLKFKEVQESKSKQSSLQFSSVSDLTSQSSESSLETISVDKIVSPELTTSALPDTEKRSHAPRRKRQESKLPLKVKSEKPRFCHKEYYMKINPYIYQHGKAKPVIASLAGTSKQAVLFKQPAPSQKPRYRRVILRRKAPSPQFTLPLGKEGRKSEVTSVPESLPSDEISLKGSIASDQESEKVLLRKRRSGPRRREGSLIEKKMKKSLTPSRIEDIEQKEEPQTEILTEEKEEIVPEESQGPTPGRMVKIPRSIEEIIANLQSERQTVVDNMIKDLIESVLGQNYDIKMEEVSLMTNFKFEEEIEKEKSEVKKVAKEEVLVEKEEDKIESEDEVDIEQIEQEEDLEETKTVQERENVELLQTVLDTKILSELPMFLDTTETQLPKREPGAFQVVSLESLQIKGKTVPASPRIKPKFQRRPFETSESPKTTSKIPEKSTHNLHKLCTTSPECVLPTDLQLASRIYHTLGKKGHDFFMESDKKDLKDEHTKNEKIRDRILYGVSTSDAKGKTEKSSSEKPTALVKVKTTDQQPSFQLLGEEVPLYPGSVKMFWTLAPPKFSAPVSLIRQTLYPQYESSCTFRQTMDKSLSVSEESFYSKDREKKSEKPKFKVMKSKSLTTLPKIDEAKKMINKAASVFNFAMQNDSISSIVPDDIRSNLNELENQQEYFLKCLEENENNMYDYLDITDLPETETQKSGQKKTHPKDVSQKTRRFIVFPRRKRRKLRKRLSSEKLKFVLNELAKPPQTLKRSKSLVILLQQKKFFLRVPIYVRRSRCPSLPSVLNFDKFVEKHGGIPKNIRPYHWALDFWISEYHEFAPSPEPEFVEQGTVQTAPVETVPAVPIIETKNLSKIELDDFINPDLSEHVVQYLEKEIEKLTQELKQKQKMPAFLYCRRGAIYRKLGKLKMAMDDLQEAIFLEPLLLNAYWHRHFIYLFQNRTGDALDDLNFITKYNRKNADVYLSKAEIFKKRGNQTLALLNYTQAIKCRPKDDDIYFKRAEMLLAGNKLLAIDDYSRCISLNPKKAEAYLRRGIYHFENSNWSPAIQDFSALLNLDYKNIQARTYRGRAFFKRGFFRDATEDLSIAIHYDPNNWIAFYYRGCIFRKSNPNKALQDFSISVLINDTLENILSFLHRGILYAEMSSWGLAIADFESVLNLDRKIAFAHINIGLIYMLHLDKYFEAIYEFTEAIRVDPLCIQSYLCRAQTYYKLHKLSQAIKDMSRVIHLQPDGIQLYIIRGRYLLEMKCHDLAKSTIFQVAQMNKGSFELSPIQQSLVFSFCNYHHEALKLLFSVTLYKPEPGMFILLGKAQMKAKKLKNAMTTFKKALEIMSNSDKIPKGSFLPAECSFLLGLCYMKEDNLYMAIESFNKAVKAYPDYPEAFYQRGLCKVKVQRDKCVQDFNRAITLNPKHYKAYISRAAFYGLKGRYSKAILNCNEAIRIFPNSVRAYLYRGVLKFYNKTYKLAITDLNIAISLNKNCFLAFYNRAICFSKIKEFDSALKDYGIVLLLDVGDDIRAKTLINRGLIYTELKMTANALADFREAMHISEDNASLFQAAGICHHRIGEYEEAVCSFTRVIELNPFFVDAYVGRGNSYMEYGHEAAERQAQKDFLKALHFNPAHLNARISFGYNLQGKGKFQKAWNQFTICVDIDPGNYQAYEGRGIVCLQMGNNFAAIQDINSALKITTSAEFLTNRGVIHEFMGERHIAMKDYQAAISMNPKYSLAYFNAGNIYLHHRQFSQAIEFYSKALHFDPQNDSAALNRAITNTILQKFEEAKEDFIKAIELCPFWGAVYYGKALLYYSLQQYEIAEEDLTKALSLQPNDHLAYKLRADIRGKMGKTEEALKDYNQSLDLQEFASY